MYKKFFLITTILFLTVFLYPNFLVTTFAQVLNQNDVSIELIPKNPKPNDTVKINLSSYSANINTALIKWTINNKLGVVGIGKTSYEVSTGGLGSTTNIIVEVSFDTFNQVTKTITIKPTEVDLIWESVDSYVPPFYKGLALPSSESTINIVAQPNIKTDAGLVKSKDLNYLWKRNYDNMPDNSGYGKNNFLIKANYLIKNDVIEVSAGTINQNYGAINQINISTFRPKIIFYQDSPLYGVDLANALNNGFSPKESQTSIFASPYFFSVKDPLNNDLIYKWKINDKNIDTPKQKNEITVKPVSNQSGIARIDLAIESASKLFDEAIATLQLTLNGQ